MGIPDCVRVGEISSLNYEEGTAKVIYPDKNDAVSKEIPFMWFEYDMPVVGDYVYVVLLNTGVEDGLIIGRYYMDGRQPIEPGAHIWRKEFGEDTFARYNRDTKTFTLKAENIVLEGNVEITGTLEVKETLTIQNDLLVSGDIHTEKELEVKGSLLVEKDLDVKGNANINGMSSDDDTIFVKKNVVVEKDFTVEKETELKKNLHVIGKIEEDGEEV